MLSAFPYVPETRLLWLTYAGNLVLVSVEDLPLQQRVGKGTLMHDLRRDPAAAAILVM